MRTCSATSVSKNKRHLNTDISYVVKTIGALYMTNNNFIIALKKLLSLIIITALKAIQLFIYD